MLRKDCINKSQPLPKMGPSYSIAFVVLRGFPFRNLIFPPGESNQAEPLEFKKKLSDTFLVSLNSPSAANPFLLLGDFHDGFDA